MIPTWALWGFIGMQWLNALLTIALIGTPRKPISKGIAVQSTLAAVILTVLITYWMGLL